MQLAATQMLRTREALRHHSAGPARHPGSNEIDSDVFLRQIIETCASSVAVLDEAGTVLYVSRRWSESSADGESVEPEALIGKSLRLASGDGPDPLAEDLELLLDGRAREFHKEYSQAGFDRSSWFRVHAARLDLPLSNSFRVLATRDRTNTDLLRFALTSSLVAVT